MIAVRNMRVLDARRLLRRGDMLGRLDHGDIEGGVVGDADLRSRPCMGADRLHAEAVGEDAVMTDLVHLCGRQLHPRRVDALQVAKIGEAAKLVDGHEVLDAVRSGPP